MYLDYFSPIINNSSTLVKDLNIDKNLLQDYPINRSIINFSHLEPYMDSNLIKRDAYDASDFSNEVVTILKRDFGYNWKDYFLCQKFYIEEYDQFFNQYAFGKLIYTAFDENNTFKTLRNSKYFKSLNNTTKVFINNDFKRYKLNSRNALYKVLQDTYSHIRPFIANDKKCMPVAVLLYSARHMYKKNLLYFDSNFNLLNYNNLKNINHVMFGLAKVVDVFPYEEKDYMFYKNKYIEEFPDVVRYYNKMYLNNTLFFKRFVNEY